MKQIFHQISSVLLSIALICYPLVSASVVGATTIPKLPPELEEKLKDLRDIDQTQPFAFALINKNAKYAKDGLVNLDIFLHGSITQPIDIESFRLLKCTDVVNCNSNFPTSPNWGSWQTLSGTKYSTISGGYYISTQIMLSNPQSSGNRSICVQAKDGLSRLSTKSALSCDSIILDNVAPTGSALIDDGAAETHSLDMWAQISAADGLLADGTTGVGGLEYSVSADKIPWQSWTKLNGTTKQLIGHYPVELTQPTTIIGYVKFRDALGNESPIYSDSILFSPLNAAPTIKINNGATFSASRTVSLALQSGKSASQMKVWNRGTNSDLVGKIAYAESLSWNLTAGYGEKQVYVQYFYTDGSVSAPQMASIIYAPEYGIKYDSGITTYAEYTLNNIPSRLSANTNFNFVVAVTNTGSRNWLNNTHATTTGSNAVHLSYHWYQIDQNGNRVLYDYEGNRGGLNQNLDYMHGDSNVRFFVDTPSQTGKYILQFDAVMENPKLDDEENRIGLNETNDAGIWFSKQGNQTPEIAIEITPQRTEAVAQVAGITQVAAQTDFLTPQTGLTLPQATKEAPATPSVAGGTYYIVQPPRPWDPSWRCGGYDCYSSIAEDYYHCSAKGIPNDAPDTTNRIVLITKCWWKIYAANEFLYSGVLLDPYYNLYPWQYLQPGWRLFIPGGSGGNAPPTDVLPAIPSGFAGLAGTSTSDPYGQTTIANLHRPTITFDSFIAWNGSQKYQQIKSTETTGVDQPVITSIMSNGDTNTATVYGVAIPKNFPMLIRVWNEYRYCVACGSDWELREQMGTAQHVKIVLFKSDWTYLGQTWNDSPDGRWEITVPLGIQLNPQDEVMAEAQIEADYTFNDLHWWANTIEPQNFNLRDRKYTGYPYFGSGAGLRAAVPFPHYSSNGIWAIIYRQTLAYNGYQTAGDIHALDCNTAALIRDYNYFDLVNDTWKTYTNLIYNPHLNWAFRLRGDIRLAYWNSYGGVCGSIGLPITDDLPVKNPDGITGGYQKFENGTISSSSHGTFITPGNLNTTLEEEGGMEKLGFPLENLQLMPDLVTATQRFENKVITAKMCSGNYSWDMVRNKCFPHPVFIKDYEKIPLTLQTKASPETCIPSLGCGITSMSMVLKYYGIDKSPEDVLKDNSGDCNMTWNVAKYSNSLLGIRYYVQTKYSLYQTIRREIDAGNPVIGWSSNMTALGTHFVVIYGYDETKFFIKDPLGKYTTLGYDSKITIGTARAVFIK